MAYIVNMKIENQMDQYLLDAKNVKGTYVVVASIGDRDGLPEATRVIGSLCYVTSENKFYQYDGENWQLAEFSGVRNGTDKVYLEYDDTLKAITFNFI